MLNMNNALMRVQGNGILNQDVFANENSFVRILFIVISAIVANANSPEEIEDFATARKMWIKRNICKDFRRLEGEMLSFLLSSIRPEKMTLMFERWLGMIANCRAGRDDSLGEDAVVESFMRATGFTGLGCASLAVSPSGLVFENRSRSQQGADGKFVANVLDLFDISGTVVSIDAEGVHPDVAAEILTRGGDYLLSVRSRQKKFYNDLVLIFNYGMINKDIFDYSFSFYHDDSPASEILSFDIINDMFWIQESNIYKDAKSIIRVVSTRIDKNRTRTESRYYVSSAEFSPQDADFYQKDFWFFRDDKVSVLDVSANQNTREARNNHTNENMASLRNVALKLLDNGSSTSSLSDGVRKKAAWDGDFLSRVLAGSNVNP